MAVRTKPTLKQERFARAYVLEANGAEAAIQAGYKVKSRQSAAVVASDNLTKPKVQRAIADWRLFLEDEILPSLETVRRLRDQSEDGRLRLAAARDLLNRAGAGRPTEGRQPVVAVFATMSEDQLLEKIAQVNARKLAEPSQKVIDVSHTIQCATSEQEQEKNQKGVGGSEAPPSK